MLERELSGDTAAGGYIEVGGYRSRGLKEPVMEREREREHPGKAEGRSRRRVRSTKEEGGKGREGKESDSV